MQTERPSTEIASYSHNGIVCSSKNGEITTTHDNIIESYKHNIEQKEGKFLCDDRHQHSCYLWGESGGDRVGR